MFFLWFFYIFYTAVSYDALQEVQKCVQRSVCGCMFTKGCGWGGGRVCHSPLTGPAALRCPACAFQALKRALCA